MNRQNKGSLSEKQMGYLLILPALLIILIIAIWPVMRSFWISLHDIRLNDPTKTEVHSSYGLDMERYVSTFPNLLRYVKKKRRPPRDLQKTNWRRFGKRSSK